MSPTSANPGRWAIVRASAPIWSASCSGERRAPTWAPATGRQEASRSRQRRIGALATRVGGRVDEVQLVDAVDHQGDRRGGTLGCGQLGQRAMVGGRIAHEDVVAGAGALQPERLGEAVRHDPVPAGAGQDLGQQRPATHGLAGDPDRLTRGAGHERGRVGVVRLGVEYGEGRVELGGSQVEPRAQVRLPARRQVIASLHH
jgi:hypothetical protein